MPSRIDLGGIPFFEIGSHPRSGPGRRDRFSREDLELLERTVRKTPEVMVKVLSHGAHDRKAVARHLRYLNRRGDLDIETDDGERLRGDGAEKTLIEDWNLDLDEIRASSRLDGRPNGRTSRLVHKVLLSMPPGTAPEKVLAAVKAFAREEFGLQHRYAMVLHTDEPHPHVHLVVKAVSEQGERLNIRKETLRNWRKRFAAELRNRDVAANSTSRTARGKLASRAPDTVFRAMERNFLWRHERRNNESHSSLEKVLRQWSALGQALKSDGHIELAHDVQEYTAGLTRSAIRARMEQGPGSARSIENTPIK